MNSPQRRSFKEFLKGFFKKENPLTKDDLLPIEKTLKELRLLVENRRKEED